MSKNTAKQTTKAKAADADQTPAPDPVQQAADPGPPDAPAGRTAAEVESMRIAAENAQG